MFDDGRWGLKGGFGGPWPDEDGLRWPLGVAVGTMLLHGLLVLWLPMGIFRKYAVAAELRLGGELASERLLDFSPLYLAVSTLAERMLARPEAVLAALQILLVSIGAGLLWCVLRRRFGRLLAGLGTLVFVSDRHLLVYERVLEPEAFLLFFLLVVLFAIDRPDGSSALLAGVAGGLSLATRPNLLPVLLLAPVYLYWRRQDGPGWNQAPGRIWLRQALLFALPICLTLGLLTLRSWTITGEARAPVMNPGTVFYEGNHPLSLGTSAVYPPVVQGYLEQRLEVPDSPHQTYRDVARAATGQPLTPREVNAYWSGRAMDYLRQDTWRGVKHLLRKVWLGLGAFRWHDVPLAAAYDTRMPLPFVPFSLLASLALLGLLMEWRRWRSFLLFYALFASQLGVMMVFYVSARQRLPLLPAILFFALAAVERTMAWWRAGKRPWSLLVALLAGSLAFFLALPSPEAEDESYRQQGSAVAQGLLARMPEQPEYTALRERADLAVGALTAAPWALERVLPAFLRQEEETVPGRALAALAKMPDLSPRRFDRAVLLAKAGRSEEATALLEALVAVGYVPYRKAMQPSHPRFYLGRLKAEAGEVEGAREQWQAVLEERPEDPFALAELHSFAPEPELRERIEAHYSGADAHYLLGRAFLAQGRFQEAVEELGTLVRMLPDFRPGLVYLAAACGEAGLLDQGAAAYQLAMELSSEPVLLEAEILSLFSRWLKQRAKRPEAWVVTARVFRQLGHFEEASALLEGKSFPPALRAVVRREKMNLELLLPPPSPALP